MQHSEDLEGILTVQESVIRRMTRLAIQHNAVNLAQGFTDEAPPYDLVWGGIAAILGGTDEGIEQLESLSLKEILGEQDDDSESQTTICLRDLLSRVQNSSDRLNQYSFPFGLPELREAIARYTLRFSGFRPDPEREITVVLGATEGLAAVLRATCSPGDGVLILQPFHEMYPSQAKVFGIRPEFISLKEDRDSGDWILDREELEASLGRNIRALILNTPHNPTGKVFTRGELEFIAASCRRHGVLIITDAFGSTPSNIATRAAAQYGARVVAGINLSMLVRVYNYPQLALDDLAASAIEAGRAGVMACPSQSER